MKSYPIKNENYQSEFTSIGSWAYLPLPPFGEKIYALYDNVLRAIIPLATAIAIKNDSKNRAMQNYACVAVVCKVAGDKANKLFYMDSCYGDGIGVKCFKTIEDYEYYLLHGTENMVFPKIRVTEILECDFGYELYKYTNMPQMYGMDDYSKRPERMTSGIKALWIDDEGSHVELTMKHHTGTPVYPTADECIIAGRARVVDFSDDDDEPTNKEFWVDLPKKVSVTAKTEEEAKDKVRDALDQMVR